MAPRRVTLEHEAAHAVIVHQAGGRVDFIELSPAIISVGVASLGRASWGPAGKPNCALAGYAAGPAQTQISVTRDALSQSIADDAFRLEARSFAEGLAGGKLPNYADADRILRKNLPVMTTYLNDPKVQQAVLTIADRLEQAEQRNQQRVDWAALVAEVNWIQLPPVPQLDWT